MDNLEKHSDFWLRDGEKEGDYGNRYIRVYIAKPSPVTNDDVQRLESIYETERLLDGVMYGYTEYLDNGVGVIGFSIHKGDFDTVRVLSEKYPECVVTANSDWDEVDFCAFKAGVPYGDLHAEWDDGIVPEPYQEGHSGPFYDCDAKVVVRLPLSDDKTFSFPVGGGMRSKEDFELIEHFTLVETPINLPCETNELADYVKTLSTSFFHLEHSIDYKVTDCGTVVFVTHEEQQILAELGLLNTDVLGR